MHKMRLGFGLLLFPLLACPLVSATTTMPALAAQDTSLTVKADGTVWGWGYNGDYELGLGDSSNRHSPTQISGLADMTALAMGSESAYAVKRDGTVWAWGYNGNGELGMGDTTDRTTPDQITALSGVASLAAGVDFAFALKRDGTVWGWGNNASGYLGLGSGDRTVHTAPVQLTDLSDIVALATEPGEYSALALKRDGTVWAWGNNSHGNLGLGDTSNRDSPVQNTGLTDIVAITIGFDSSMALKRDGTVWAWGYNTYGGLGLGDTTEHDSPVQITDLSNIVAIASGGGHSMALGRDGRVWVWGLNGYGQLGLGDSTERDSPVVNTSLSGVVAILAGNQHSMALKSDGSLWAFGDNSSGQLGLGDTTFRDSPTQVNAGAAVSSTFTNSMVDLGYLRRGLVDRSSLQFAVTTASSTMTMDFAPADIVGGNLSKYIAGSCTTGVIGDSDAPCYFSVSSRPVGRIGLVRELMVIPTDDSSFVKAVMLPVVAKVTGAMLYSDTRTGYDFDIHALGDNTDKIITYSNKGDADLHIGAGGVSAAGTGYSVLTDNCSGQTLHVDASCTVTVRFTPSLGGVFNGRVKVLSDDPAYPTYSLALVGRGAAPRLVVSGALDFGSVSIGNHADLTETLANKGTQGLTFYFIYTSSPQYTVVTDNCSPAIAVNASCTVVIRYTPTTLGAKRAHLEIDSDTPVHPSFVGLRGVGI